VVILVALFSSTGAVLSQNISIDLKDATVKSAMDLLQSKYDYSFSLNMSDVDADKRVTYKANNADLPEVLKAIFIGQDVKFALDGKVITVTRTQTQQPAKKVELKGKVYDETGETVIGATVMMKGTSNGTITNISGDFELSANTGEVLLISCIGYDEQEFLIAEQTAFEISLVPSVVGLNEVVVTALGIKRSEKALSYNVQQVSNEELVTNKDVNFVNSLNGKVAGVTINSSSGVGGASKVVMRGTKSITQSSNALYVIDGVPMFNTGGGGDTEYGSAGATDAIADLNPEDIESMSVLTGAAAAALYGSNAANGAILITTKKGKAGVTSVTVSSTTEIAKAFVTPNFQNRYGTGNLNLGISGGDRSWGHYLNEANYMGYSPADDFLQTGVNATQSIALTTGSEKNQTYLSASNVNSKGIVPNNSYDRLNFTFRNSTSFLNDKMKLDVGASYIKQSDVNMVNQGIYSNPLVTAYLFPRGDDWNDIKMYERYDSSRGIYTQYWPQGLDEFAGQNPYWIANRNLRESNRERYLVNASLSYELNDWLSLASRVRVDNSVNEYEEKFYATSNRTITEGSENGLYGIKSGTTHQTYADFIVNINKSFNENLTLHANIGTSISDMQEYTMMNRGPIRSDGIPNLFNVFQLDDINVIREQEGWREQTQSVFASAELGFKNAYYLTLTGRNDWASQLAGPNSNASSFFYPSIGTSFVLSEIFTLPKQIQYLKARASYASVGMPFPRFLANPTYVWDNANKVWQNQAHYPMYSLKPERTESLEFGFTARFLRNFDVDFSYYETKTFNQTFDPQISVSSGYSTLYVQTGNVKNSGVELSLGYSKNWSNFRWNSRYTFSTNKNEILELVEDYKHPETGAVITKNRLDIGGLSQARFILKKGGSLGDLYSTVDLKRDSEGNIYVDPDGNVMEDYDVGDIKLGSVLPKANMGWRNDVSFKNFNVGVLVTARIGGIVYSATQAAMDLYGVSEVSAIARDNGGVNINGGDYVDPYNWYTTVGAKSGIPQYYTYSATNVRLQEASVGYTFSKDKLKNIGEVTLSLVGRNLWMIYNKAPFDPETIGSTDNYYQGIDNFMMPSQSSIGFNVRVKF